MFKTLLKKIRAKWHNDIFQQFSSNVDAINLSLVNMESTTNQSLANMESTINQSLANMENKLPPPLMTILF